MSRYIPPDAPDDPTVLLDSATSMSPSESTISTGDSVTFTAVVSDPTGAGTPTGHVQFYDGGTLLGTVALMAGVATFTTTALLGTVSHSITATYLGDSTYSSSTSPVVVTSAGTVPGSGTGGGSGSPSLIVTTLALASSATTILSGAMVTLTATLTPAAVGASAPTGTVAFYDGGTLLATVALTGGTTAATVVTFTGTAAHALTAIYSGDSIYVASASGSAVVNSSDPDVATFLPWMTKAPEFSFDRSIATPTAQVEIQNVSGNTVQRDSATIFSADELTGAIFIFRIWRGDCEYALLTVVGNVKDPKIAPDGESMTLPLQGMFHFSDIQAPTMDIGVGCDLTFGSNACGSTSLVPCNNDYGSCSSRERFPGEVSEWAGATVDATQTVQPEPLRIYNGKRS